MVDEGLIVLIKSGPSQMPGSSHQTQGLRVTGFEASCL